MKRITRWSVIALLMFGSSWSARATLVGFPVCGGAAVACEIASGASIPNPVTKDPNNSKLIAWDEVQNLTLTENLYIDRVFDLNADFVGSDTNGTYLEAGTVVSSHYVQWDPIASRRVVATIQTDSQIFAFIYSDDALFSSDEFLGLPGIDYNDFDNRGIEGNTDSIVFNGDSVDISWSASSPGDWARMITAYSPGAGVPRVPVPAAFWLFGTALMGLFGLRKRRKST